MTSILKFKEPDYSDTSIVHEKNFTITFKKNSLNIIDTLWNKANIVEGYDPDTLRKDACGAWIRKRDYQNSSSEYGWGIDVIIEKAVDRGNISNLRPLHLMNINSRKGKYPFYMSSVTSEGSRNISKKILCKIKTELE